MANQDTSKQRNTLVGKFHRNWDTYIIPIRWVGTYVWAVVLRHYRSSADV